MDLGRRRSVCAKSEPWSFGIKDGILDFVRGTGRIVATSHIT